MSAHDRTLAINHIMDLASLNMTDEDLEARAVAYLDLAMSDGRMSPGEHEDLREVLLVSLAKTQEIGERCKTANRELEALGTRTAKTAPCGAVFTYQRTQ